MVKKSVVSYIGASRVDVSPANMASTIYCKIATSTSEISAKTFQSATATIIPNINKNTVDKQDDFLCVLVFLVCGGFDVFPTRFVFVEPPVCVDLVIFVELPVYVDLVVFVELPVRVEVPVCVEVPVDVPV